MQLSLRSTDQIYPSMFLTLLFLPALGCTGAPCAAGAPVVSRGVSWRFSMASAGALGAAPQRNAAVLVMSGKEYLGAIASPMGHDDACALLQSAEAAFVRRCPAAALGPGGTPAQRKQSSAAAAGASGSAPGSAPGKPGAASTAKGSGGQLSFLASLKQRKVAQSKAAAEAEQAQLGLPVIGPEKSLDPQVLHTQLHTAHEEAWKANSGKPLVLQAQGANAAALPASRAVTVTARLSTEVLPTGIKPVFMPFCLVSDESARATQVEAIATLVGQRYSGQPPRSVPTGAIRPLGGDRVAFFVESGYKQRDWKVSRRYLTGKEADTVSMGSEFFLRLAFSPQPDGGMAVVTYLNGHPVMKTHHPAVMSLVGSKFQVLAPARGDYGEVATTVVHQVWLGEAPVTEAMQRLPVSEIQERRKAAV